MDKAVALAVEKAKKDKEVIAVLLFGSTVKGKGKDIDLCIVLGKQKSNLEMSRKRLEYQKLSDKLDIQILQQLPLYVRKEVIAENKILLMKDYDLLFDIAVSIIKEFGFFEKYYKDYLEHVKHGNKAKAIV